MKEQELSELEFQNPRTKWSGDKQSTWQWIQTWDKNGWTQWEIQQEVRRYKEVTNGVEDCNN